MENFNTLLHWIMSEDVNPGRRKLTLLLQLSQNVNRGIRKTYIANTIITTCKSLARKFFLNCCHNCNNVSPWHGKLSLLLQLSGHVNPGHGKLSLIPQLSHYVNPEKLNTLELLQHVNPGYGKLTFYNNCHNMLTLDTEALLCYHHCHNM